MGSSWIMDDYSHHKQVKISYKECIGMLIIKLCIWGKGALYVSKVKMK